MASFITYILQASVYLLLFALGYQLLLSRRIHAVFNRFYLLGSMAASLLLPLLPTFDFSTPSPAAPVIVTNNLPELIVTAGNGYNGAVHQLSEGLGSSAFVGPLLLTGSALVFLLFVWQIIRIALWVSRFGSRRLSAVRIIEMPDAFAPFSFFGWIFVPKSLVSSREFTKILAHEQAHAQNWHSADVLFISLLQSVFWLHPAFYYFKRELRAMHEYQADRVALGLFDKIEYQQSLLSISISGGMSPLSNPFNVSLIKKRMFMMNQQQRQKPARNWFKMMALLPFVGALVALQSCNFNSTETAQPEAVAEQIMATTVDSAGNKTTQMVDPVKEFADAQPDTDEVFTVVQEIPEYPGGTEAMMKFLADNIKYPAQAISDSIQGRVFINFIVEKNGRISSAKVLRGIGGGCDEEAVRVVELMPSWIPGKQRGENVRVSFNMPIKFTLE